MGVGAMTDFGPLLANPRTLLLGAAAQFGSQRNCVGALTLNYFGISFTLPQVAAIGIIGAPTARRARRRRSCWGSSRQVVRTPYGAGAADPAADHEGADHG